MKIAIKSIVILMILNVFLSYLFWHDSWEDDVFECRAQLSSQVVEKECKRTSIVDVFLAIHNNGKGFLLISGSWSCPAVTRQSIDTIIDFDYTKEGHYYSLQLGEMKPGVNQVFDALKQRNIKIKLTKIDEYDYKVSTPVQTLMVCTRD